MRKHPAPNKVAPQPNSNKHSRRGSIESIQLKKIVKNNRKAPSKSPSLQPFYRSNSHEQINAGLSFNKQISKGRYENSIDNVNTKQQTFITNEQSSYRSTIQCQSQNTKRKSIGKDSKHLLSAQKSFFQSIESKASKKSAPKIPKQKKLKVTLSKNTERTKKSKEKKTKSISSSKKDKVEPFNGFKAINENIFKKGFELKKLKFQKRITEVSEEEFQCTMGSPKLINNNFFSKPDPEHQIQVLSRKVQYQSPACQLLRKVKQQVESMLSRSYSQQSKLLVAVIFIQKLWRQKYVKKMINNFLRPREETPRLRNSFGNSSSNSNPLTKYQLKFPKNDSCDKKNIQTNKSPIQTPKKQKVDIVQKAEKYLDRYKVQTPKVPAIKKVKSLNYECFLPKTLLLNKIDKNIDTMRIQRIKEAKNKFLASGRKQIKFYFQNTSQTNSVQTTKQMIKQGQQETVRICSQITHQIIGQFLTLDLGKYKSNHQTKQKKVSLPTIKVSTRSIEVYIEGLIVYLLQSNHKQTIINNLNKPLGIKPIAFLKFMRTNNNQQDDEQEQLLNDDQDDEFCNQPVVPAEIFLEYQEYLEEKHLNSDQTYKNFKKNIQRIYNKAIIDAFSQLLQQKRLYGLKGKPFPWQKATIQTVQKMNNKLLKQNMNKCQNQVLRYSTYKFGNRYGIDQKKFLGLLSEQYAKSEYEWKAYDQQVLEINLQISSQIILLLVQEICEEILLK